MWWGNNKTVMCAIFSPCGKDMLMYDCLPAFRLGVKRSYLLQYSTGECYSDNTAVSFSCVAWTGESLCYALHVTRCIEKRTHFTITKKHSHTKITYFSVQLENVTATVLQSLFYVWPGVMKALVMHFMSPGDWEKNPFYTLSQCVPM